MAQILVIEDDDHIRHLISTVLQSVGHTTTEAQHGREALHLLNTSPCPFDLILLDMRMPTMDGVEFLAQFKSQFSTLSIPVLVISAHWEQVPAALQNGATGQLIKPFSRQKLIDLVNNTMSRSIR